MELQCKGALALEIGPRHVHFRARGSATIYLLLEFQVRIGFKRAASADGGDACREIEPRKAECHFSENAVTHGVEQMVMHADQARNNGVAVQVEKLRVTGHPDCGSIADRCDLSL